MEADVVQILAKALRQEKGSEEANTLRDYLLDEEKETEKEFNIESIEEVIASLERLKQDQLKKIQEEEEEFVKKYSLKGFSRMQFLEGYRQGIKGSTKEMVKHILKHNYYEHDELMKRIEEEEQIGVIRRWQYHTVMMIMIAAKKKKLRNKSATASEREEVLMEYMQDVKKEPFFKKLTFMKRGSLK